MTSINNINVHRGGLPPMCDRTKEKLYAALMDRSPEPNTKGNLNLWNILVERGDPENIIENMNLHQPRHENIECIRRERGKSMAMVELLKTVVDNEMINEFYSALISAKQGSLAQNILDKYKKIEERMETKRGKGERTC